MDLLQIALRLRGHRETKAGLESTARSVGDVGKAQDRAARSATRHERATRRQEKGLSHLNTGARRTIGVLGGITAGFLSISAARGAIDTTLGLAKAQFLLARTGLSDKDAGHWAAILRTRNIEANVLRMTLTKLSTAQQAALGGGKTQLKQFAQLGISSTVLKAHSRDLGGLLTLVSDRMGKLGKGTERTALAQQLLGRGSGKLSALLLNGSDEFKKQASLADKYGVTLGGKPIKSQKDLIEVQHEMEMAQLGMQVQFATKVVPALVKGYQKVLPVMQFMIDKFGPMVDGITKFGAQHPHILQAAGALVAVGLAIKTIRFLGMLTEIGRVRSALGLLASTTAGQKMKASILDGLSGLTGGVKTRVATVADTAATSAGTSFAAKEGRFRGVGSKAGKWIGRGIGIGIVAGLVIEAPTIAKWISDTLSPMITDSLPSWVPGSTKGTKRTPRGREIVKTFGNQTSGQILDQGAADLLAVTPKLHPLKRAHGGSIPAFGRGGLVPHGDQGLIGARRGEFMMRESAVDRFGVGFMRDINAGRVPPMANTAGGAGAADLAAATAAMRAAVENLTTRGIPAYVGRRQATKAIEREQAHRDTER